MQDPPEQFSRWGTIFLNIFFHAQAGSTGRIVWFSIYIAGISIVSQNFQLYVMFTALQLTFVMHWILPLSFHLDLQLWQGFTRDPCQSFHLSWTDPRSTGPLDSQNQSATLVWVVSPEASVTSRGGWVSWEDTWGTAGSTDPSTGAAFGSMVLEWVLIYNLFFPLIKNTYCRLALCRSKAMTWICTTQCKSMSSSTSSRSEWPRSSGSHRGGRSSTRWISLLLTRHRPGMSFDLVEQVEP